MLSDLATKLWFTFFYVGLFTIGGGYVMLPFLEKELVDKQNWLTHDELIDIFALGQSTPGIIAINVATYVGVKKRGVCGGIISTIGMVMPSLIIIMTVAFCWDGINSDPTVIKIFKGIRAVVAGLLVAAVYKLSKKSIKDLLGWSIFFISFIFIVFLNVSPIFVVITAAVLGIAWYSFLGINNAKGK